MESAAKIHAVATPIVDWPGIAGLLGQKSSKSTAFPHRN